jgi:hypothetical protein
MVRYLKNQSPIRTVLTTIAFSLLFTIAGCKKNDAFQDNPSKKTRPARPRSAADGVNDLLGYGYDITGEYGNSSASRFAVINIAALQRALPSRVEWDFAKRQAGKLTSGENATSYLDKLTLTMDGTFGFKAFSGTIKSSFSSTDVFSAKYVYSSFDLLMQQKRGKMSGGPSLLKQYLHPSFLWDIEFESPEFIVSAYGTHVLTDITLGAKLNIMYRSETNNTQRERASQIGLDVNVPKVFNLSVGLSYTYTQKETEDNFSQALHYKTIGGNPSRSLIGDIPVGNNPPTVDITSWQQSCTFDNAEMIDFNNQALIPLYEFIDDPVKKQAVKNYISDYIKFYQPILERTYAKLSKENPHVLNGITYYDYYVRFFKEDKVTPITVGDVTVEYYNTDWPGMPMTKRIVDENYAYLLTESDFFTIKLSPRQGYEILE